MINWEDNIKIINNLVLECIKHGGDAGGSWDSNEKGVIKSLESFIQYNNLQNEYIIKTIKVIKKGEHINHVYIQPQIVKKEIWDAF